jgi:hypothetical protein
MWLLVPKKYLNFALFVSFNTLALHLNPVQLLFLPHHSCRHQRDCLWTSHFKPVADGIHTAKILCNRQWQSRNSTKPLSPRSLSTMTCYLDLMEEMSAGLGSSHSKRPHVVYETSETAPPVRANYLRSVSGC